MNTFETRRKRNPVGQFLVFALALVVFGLPFLFIVVNSLKDRRNAGLMQLSLPDTFHFENYRQVFEQNNHMVLQSFWNSTVITVCSLVILIGLCSLAGYVLQRRHGKLSVFVNYFLLIGLMLPPAILPTIWVLQKASIYGSKTGMVLVEVVLNIPFTMMLFRSFVGTIPLELEEAAIMEGCSRQRLFWTIVFPLLAPVTATVIVLNAVSIFNDFTNPLYFLPGVKNATVQLTLNTFMGQYASSWHLLFADVVLITIPPFILFLFFNRKIIDGMTAGAVKG